MFHTILFRCAAVVFSLASIQAASAQQPAPGQRFQVFDALLYQGKPDLRPYGMPALRGANPPGGLSDDPAVPLDEAPIRAILQQFAGYTGPVFLDYESWPLTGASPQSIEESVKKYIRVADVAHEIAPTASFGIYGLIPCREYWGIVTRDPKKMADWNACNRQAAKVADHVAVLFPSLYTFYDNPAAWDLYAKGMLAAARQYGKPVYAFLWPEFHPSNRVLGGQNIPAKFWRHQLDLCHGLADGVVIWGGWKEQWRDDAPWWIETKGFLATLNHH